MNYFPAILPCIVRLLPGSITLLSGQGIVQTVQAGGLIHVGAGEHVSIYIQVTGHIFLLAGSHFSGVMIG